MPTPDCVAGAPNPTAPVTGKQHRDAKPMQPGEAGYVAGWWRCPYCKVMFRR